MSTVRNVIVQSRVIGPAPEGQIEMCEHKGIGHPDTPTDRACEAAACALAAACENSFDRVLHFNVDKGLLIAGASVSALRRRHHHRADQADHLRAGHAKLGQV